MKTKKLLLETLMLFIVIPLFQHSTKLYSQDYPMRSGGGTSSSVVPGDLDVLDDFRYATVRWKSEWVGNPRGGSDEPGRYGCGNVGKLGSGGASPIIYDGKVYLWWYYPTGGPDSIYDSDMMAMYLNTCGATMEDVIRELGVLSTEVVMCVDLHTGETLWKTVYDAVSMYGYDQTKNQIRNYTMAAGDGKVFNMSASGYVYCHDANTGAMLWKTATPSLATWQQKRTDAINLREAQDYPNNKRNHGSSVAYADGVVISPEHASDKVSGYRASDGVMLWTINDFGRYSNPLVWEYGGKKYVVIYNTYSTRLIDHQDGTVMWTIPSKSTNESCGGGSVSGKYLLCGTDVGGVAHPTVFEITPTTYTKLWDAGQEGVEFSFFLEDTAYITTVMLTLN